MFHRSIVCLLACGFGPVFLSACTTTTIVTTTNAQDASADGANLSVDGGLPGLRDATAGGDDDDDDTMADGGTKDAGPAPKDSGVPAVVCAPSPVTSSGPPAIRIRTGECTPSQIMAWKAACAGAGTNCSAFEDDAANEACILCTQSLSTDTWGPMVFHFPQGQRGGYFGTYNTGACVRLVNGDVPCGNALMELRKCSFEACSDTCLIPPVRTPSDLQGAPYRDAVTAFQACMQSAIETSCKTIADRLGTACTSLSGPNAGNLPCNPLFDDAASDAEFDAMIYGTNGTDGFYAAMCGQSPRDGGTD